ncbi:MAG: hypothetical protein HN802_01740 [Candidatus Jacksonbacteria bacterium]|nr:hypothetical protein [Candidatus Jacksonbacteria bacterium]
MAPKKKNTNKHLKHEAHIIAVDMGYGHERAAYGLKHLAVEGEGIIIANNYSGIPRKDSFMWNGSRKIYETLSRAKSIPLVGNTLFGFIDKMQTIPPFYPARDLSAPTGQTKQNYASIRAGLGRDLINRLRKNPVPIITTFFLTAFMAEEYDYPGDIYCVTTDTDISRAWAPFDPRKSRIKYVAATGRCVERLKLYGVKDKNIIHTGFPLPPELVGGTDPTAVKKALRRRLQVLDPHGIFRRRYGAAIDRYLGPAKALPKDEVPTIMFSIGGAGAQRKLALDIMYSLRHEIATGRLRLILALGARPQMISWFERYAKYWHLKEAIGHTLIFFAPKSRKVYFEKFNTMLFKSDILWTKPSELSFYAGLGIPIVAAPPIGSQENYNLEWMQQVGGGIPQRNPLYAGEWLVDWIESGALARLAWHGFWEAPTHGAYRIEGAVFDEELPIEELPLVV